MEEILKYENRQKLYQFLIDGYGFTVMEEKDYKGMGYYVDLTSKFFLLRYANDRLFLSIDIASFHETPKHFYALSFIRDLIYNPDSINADEKIKDNTIRISGLNDFLRKDFDKICGLLNKENYSDTKRRLNEGLDKQSYIRFPSTRPK